ncbi:hypothetical protein Ocin01_00110 [Orchesella cincta]|uniref:Secreted protein n=1 Tax=Orchesella cincta TaxID=48709 RepID=A0A1D2NNA5_ORCCI|nr:hypothetical protein Ocin01_00110 [Orchesella cincta]
MVLRWPRWFMFIMFVFFSLADSFWPPCLRREDEERVEVVQPPDKISVDIEEEEDAEVRSV